MSKSYSFCTRDFSLNNFIRLINKFIYSKNWNRNIRTMNCSKICEAKSPIRKQRMGLLINIKINFSRGTMIRKEQIKSK